MLYGSSKRSKPFTSLFCDDVDVFDFSCSPDEESFLINLLKPQATSFDSIEIGSESPIQDKLKDSMTFSFNPTIIKEKQKQSLILVYYDRWKSSSFLYELETKQTLIRLKGA